MNIILIIALFFLFPFTALAADYTLLEPIPGFLPQQVMGNNIEAYLLGFFRLLIGVAGVLSVIMLTWCGFNLMLSASPSAKEDAKRCIRVTLLGLLLALSSFFILNSIQAGFGNNRFVVPLLPQNAQQGANGAPVGLPGSPVCVVQSANVNILEGQITDITAQCNPGANAYFWTVSPNAPIVAGAGGNVQFPAAGVYTYMVSGQNAAGLGQASNILTITVTRQGALSCPADMPAPVVGAMACAQLDAAFDWRPLGPGARQQDIVMNDDESVSILFMTAGAGAYGSFTAQGIVDPNTLVPFNVNAPKFINISSARCDFRYGNLDSNDCAVSGTDVTLDFQVGMGNPPAPGSPGCVLDPNTAYYINIRNEEASGGNANRGVDTCPSNRICEFSARFSQSQAAQFLPPQNVVCALPPVPGPVPPAFRILSPQNNAVFPNGNIQAQYSASDAQGLESVQFTVVNTETGEIVSTFFACTAAGGMAQVLNPNTGQLQNVVIPQCGNQRNEVIPLSLPGTAGNYRLEGRACNIAGQCERRNASFSIVPSCVNSNSLRCFILPQGPAPQGDMCTPQFGNNADITTNVTDAHRFQLPPGTRAEIIIANQPVYGECTDFVFDPQLGFSWQTWSWQPGPPTPWCHITGLLGDAWDTQTGGTCFYRRNNLQQGDMSLRAGISSSPGDVSASNQTTRASGGNAEGLCGTSERIAFGRVRLVVTTISPPQPGECFIDSGRDYYVNVATIHNVMPVRSGWAFDRYGVVFGILP